jgi:putative hydroxymethylpyrimidine transport system substrate-binding protein
MPVIVAKELGLYKKAGLDVDIVSLGDGVKVYRALLSGNIDMGLTPGAPTIIGRSNGATVKGLSANLPKFEASMIVRANVKTMADLKGKRIGIQEPGGFVDILSRSVLHAAKIDPKDVNFVSIASEDVPALVADQVDTAILHVEQ